MTTRNEREKAQNERFIHILAALLKDDDNKYCCDCDSKGPRWASWNLGIFLCIRCAGIHRNLGVHISKVKSVNLDSWTAQQVAMMKEIGNSRGRAVYEANLPDNYRRPQTDSALEQFIRAKYEHKRYIAHEWIPPNPKVDDILKEASPAKRQIKVAGHGRQQSDGGAASKASLPRPDAAKNPNRLAAIHATPHAQSSPSVDLLGLDAAPTTPAPQPTAGHHRAASADDLFGDFLSSAPLPTPEDTHQQTSQQTPVHTSVSSDLLGLNFGQPSVQQSHQPTPTIEVPSATPMSAGDQSSKQAKSKESILALYGNMPPVQSQQHSQQYYFTGGAEQQTNVNAFGGGASGNVGFGMQPQPQQPQQQQQQQQSWPGMAAYGAPQNQGVFGPQHNPFFGNPAPGGQQAGPPQQNQQAYLQQIQQKLSGLQFNGGSAGGPSGWDDLTTTSSTAPSGQTMSTNLWQ